MILTEEREYALALELEKGGNASGLLRSGVELRFTNYELLHAIITCGMPMQRLTPAAVRTRSMELLYKIFLVETALEAGGDRLQKSKRTAYLDSSEKSVISYYLGMFFTKLISRKLYGVDYLTHLNTVERMGGPGFIDYFDNEWRPDMIGYRCREDAWSVWEAKGGSNKRVQALEKGCQQAQAIEAINAKKPERAAVCMTYYDHGYLCAVLREPSAGRGEQLVLGEVQYFSAYYKPLCELFQERGMRLQGENLELTLPLPHSDGAAGAGRTLGIGMNGELLRGVMAGRYGAAREAGEGRAEEGGYTGADGVYVRRVSE